MNDINVMLDLLQAWKPDIRGGMVYSDKEVRLCSDGSGFVVVSDCRYPADSVDSNLIKVIFHSEEMFALFKSLDDLEAMLLNRRKAEWYTEEELREGTCEL